ncbi:MAG TPA: hypothetical protein VF762_12330 [Blastocatellia bacterium]|jgi:hypothetical protein
MPDVDLFSDMDALFAKARSDLASGCPAANEGDSLPEGTRCIAIVTPGRISMFVPGIPPGGIPLEKLQTEIHILPPDPPLNVSVISYTFLEALMADKTKCIPFIGFLFGFSYIGHSVVVFEGHHSALESGLRDSDVLFVDSAMLPFMKEDWLKVADRVMRPNAKVFIHRRETYALSQIVKEGSQPVADVASELPDGSRRKAWRRFWS